MGFVKTWALSRIPLVELELYSIPKLGSRHGMKLRFARLFITNYKIYTCYALSASDMM